MNSILVFDTESDGFVEEATKLWCIGGVNYQGDWNCLYTPDAIDVGLSTLHSVDVLVGHNIKGHDLPLMKKLYNWEPMSHQIIIDTLILSRLLYPKRPLPNGYKGNKTHSIEAWGYRVGRGKPEHEDWSKYSEDMGVRCSEDAEITRLVLKELEREAGEAELFYHQANDKRCNKA